MSRSDRQRPTRRPGQPQRRRPYRRSKTNPVTIILSVVGVALLIGLALIATRGRRPIVEVPSEPPKTVDLDSAVRAKIEKLKKARIPAAEARRKAEDLYAEARQRETHDMLKVLIKQYSQKEAEGLRPGVKALKPRVEAFAKRGKYHQAADVIDSFEKTHNRLLAKKLTVVKLLREELVSLRASIEVSRRARFDRDLARLKSAIAENDTSAVNAIMGEIYDYQVPPALLKKAEKIWKPFFEKAQLTEQGREIAYSGKDDPPSSPRPRPTPEDDAESSTDEDEPVEEEDEPSDEPDDGLSPGDDDDDDFFGGGKDDAGSKTSSLSTFTALTIGRARDVVVTIKGEKVELVMEPNTEVYRDTTVKADRYVDSLSPDMPVLFFGEATQLRLTEDPSNGRRLRNVEILLLGSGWPKAPSWQNPKKKELLWHSGVFVSLRPQALFRLGSQPYIVLGSPGTVVHREKLSTEDLRAGRYGAFVQGSATGLGEGMGLFTAKRIVLLPSARLAKSRLYRALLEN